LVSVGLAWFHSKYLLLFTAFVGLNLLQSAFTKWCLMEDILAKLGIAEKPRSESEITQNE
jgi:Inner membrane protein YgaP-like, transmembrane domain